MYRSLFDLSGRPHPRRPGNQPGTALAPGTVISRSEEMPPHEPRGDRQSRCPNRHRGADTEPLTARSDLGLPTVLSTAAVFALATAGWAAF